MQLLDLTAEEAALLARPPLADALAGHLTRRLAAILEARLRMPLKLVARAVEFPEVPPATPRWQPDAALATLWLTRRLGGRRPSGVSPFVSPSLVCTLNAALAECWIGTAGTVPPALAWTLRSGFGEAALAVELPQSETEMTRWARGVIGHA